MMLYYPDTVAVFLYTSVDDLQPLPDRMKLFQNYPNPFTEQTQVEVFLPEGDRLTLSVYNLAGQQVAEYDGYLDPGHHRFTFHAGHSQGYLLLASGQNHASRQVMLQVGGASSSGPSIAYDGFSPAQQGVMEAPDLQPGKASTGLVFNLGDELRYTGYVTDSAGNVDYLAKTDTPEADTGYVFEIDNELPAMPAGLSGKERVQGDSSGVRFEVEPVHGVSYVWSVPETWEIDSGQGSPEVIVSTGNASGQVSVYAENACGISPEASMDVEVFFTLHVSADPPEGGTVSPTYAEVQPGQNVLVTATANQGWEFNQWSGDYEGESDQFDLIINNDIELKANFNHVFSLKEYTVQIESKDLLPWDVSSSMYDVSGMTYFEHNGNEHLLFTGARWHLDHYLGQPPIHLIKDDSEWRFHKHYPASVMIGRNYEFTKDNTGVVFADHGVETRNAQWPLGHIHYGKFEGNDIIWTQISNDRSFYHSATSADLTGNGLTDIIGLHMGTNGDWHNNLHTFVQTSEGRWEEDRQLICFEGFENRWSSGAVLATDITGDNWPEIIKASYGAMGNENDYSIGIFKYDHATEQYKIFRDYPIDHPERGATSIRAADFNNNGHIDLALAFEGSADDADNGMQIFFNDGNNEFHLEQDLLFFDDEMQLREFNVMDIDGDGFLDITLNPFHYGDLYRIDPVWWNPDESKGIYLHNLIWKNNEGVFELFNEQDLTVYDLNPDYCKAFSTSYGPKFICIKSFHYEKKVQITEITLAMSPDSGPLPEVSTLDPFDISDVTLKSGGVVQHCDSTPVKNRGIIWGKEKDLDVYNCLGKTNDGSGAGEFSSLAAGLMPETTYYIRAYASNDNGTGYGEAIKVSTLADLGLIEVTTFAATEITQTTARVGGEITEHHDEEIIFTGIVWGSSETPEIEVNDTVQGMPEEGGYEYQVTGLDPGQKVYARAYAISSKGRVGYGNQTHFTTKDGLPLVKITSMNRGQPGLRKIYSKVLHDGGEEIQERGLVYGMNHDPDLDEHEGIIRQEGGAGEYEAALSGLRTNTKYYVRAFAVNNNGVSYSEAHGFNFWNYNDTIADIEGNKYKTVLIGGQEWMAENLKVTKDRYGNPITRYCFNNDDTNCEIYGGLYSWETATGSSQTENNSANLDICPSGWHIPGDSDWEQLIRHVSDYFDFPNEINAINGLASALKSCNQENSPFGEECIFPSHPGWSYHSLHYGTNEFGFSALAGGGREYHEYEEYFGLGTLALWWSSTIEDSGEAWARYMHRGYGKTLRYYQEKDDALSIRCVRQSDTPEVNTYPVTGISGGKAFARGEVTIKGGSDIVSHGIVWNTSPMPGLHHNIGFTDEGEGSGHFKSEITGLEPDTYYYARAYAENNSGVAYGNQVKFTTQKVTDLDNNTYGVVIIGDQEWMADNLMVTQYRNGDSILSRLHSSEWRELNEGGLAVYPHEHLDGLSSEEEVMAAYGGLYNWHAVVDPRGLCPSGWRIPHKNELEQMIAYLKDEYELINRHQIDNPSEGVGNFLKSCRQVDSPLGNDCNTNIHPRWESPEVNFGNNLSGFNALPAGRCDETGGYFSVGKSFYGWSSTESSADKAWPNELSIHSAALNQWPSYKTSGFSVRCIRDMD